VLKEALEPQLQNLWSAGDPAMPGHGQGVLSTVVSDVVSGGTDVEITCSWSA